MNCRDNMFIQPKIIKGRCYYYLVCNLRDGGRIVKDFEKCLGTKEKVDTLFECYKKVRK